jgi:hypothetical protein
VCVLTSAGKPVYSRWDGDSPAWPGFAALAAAVVARTVESADPVQSLRLGGGGGLVVFALRGPLIYLAVSRTGETEHALRATLRALHGAVLLALTAKVDARLAAAPGADLRGALRGVRAHMTNLVRLGNRTPSVWLDATPALALPPSVRASAHAALARGGAGGGLVYALLIAGPALAGWAQTRNRDLALRPAEALQLTSLVQSSRALRAADSTWMPVCLPSLDAAGYLYAHISFLGAADVAMPPPRPGSAGGVAAALATHRTRHARTSPPPQRPSRPAATSSAQRAFGVCV